MPPKTNTSTTAAGGQRKQLAKVQQVAADPSTSGAAPPPLFSGVTVNNSDGTGNGSSAMASLSDSALESLIGAMQRVTCAGSGIGNTTYLRYLHDALRSGASNLIEDCGACLALSEEAQKSLGGEAAATANANVKHRQEGGRSPPTSSAAAAALPVPTMTLLLAAATKLSALLSATTQRRRAARKAHSNTNNKSSSSASTTAATTATACGREPLNLQHQRCQSMREAYLTMMLLARLLTWHCIETAGEAGVRIGSRSTSGKATPSMMRSGAQTPRRGLGGAPPSSSSSSQIGGHTSQHRSQAGQGSGLGVSSWLGNRMSTNAPTSSGTHTDDQVAEQLLRPAVEMLVLLSTYDSRDDDDGSDDRSDSPLTSGSGGVMSRGETDCLRLHACWLLMAVLTRFSNSPFNTASFLPLLFPEKDAAVGPQARHPLLTPLLWDSSVLMRSTVSALITGLLVKLHHTLQFAEEPKKRSQSFASMATLGGTMLISLHESLHWALSDSNPSSLPPVSFSKGQLFNVYGILVEVTPYKRCPCSQATLLNTLRLPAMSQCMRVASPDSAYYDAVTFLAHVFKNDALHFVISSLFDATESSSSEGLSPLLTELLTHATTRVEVWRCAAQLSRLHPRVIHSQFESLVEVSVLVLKTVRDAAAAAAVTVSSSKREAHSNAPGTASTVADPAAKHVDPTAAAATSNTTSTTATLTVAAEVLAECLRAWIHFMGYVWKSFDGNADDPAMRPDAQQDRATLAQKQAIFTRVVLAAMDLAQYGEEVHLMTLRCLAQIGDDLMATLSPEARTRALDFVRAAGADWSSAVRAEAFTALGMWAWQYPCLDANAPDMVTCATNALMDEVDPVVRGKAAFALSNLTSRLAEGASCMTVRESPEHMAQLWDIAMWAVTEDTCNIVQGHGVRMINHLLRTLTFDELIAELGATEETVAEGFFRVLLEYLSLSSGGGRGAASVDAKLRWNAACALGVGLSREVVFEAEPVGALTAVETLLKAVTRDRIFKVRTHAAKSLGGIPAACLASRTTSGPEGCEDLTASVVRALCSALENARSTDNFSQYKEQDSLRSAVKSALSTMIATATHSNALEQVFLEYKQLLVKEELL